MDISELRSRIDLIDKELLRLFLERMELSAAIGDYKKLHGLPVYDPQREQDILNEIASRSGPEMAQYACALYQTILALSKDCQSRG